MATMQPPAKRTPSPADVSALVNEVCILRVDERELLHPGSQTVVKATPLSSAQQSRAGLREGSVYERRGERRVGGFFTREASEDVL